MMIESIKRSRISFGNHTVRSLFYTSLLTMAVAYIMAMSNTVIVGKIVGETALSAVNLIQPIYWYANFFSGIIGIGSSILYFRYLGSYQKERADQIFGQSVILALGTGLVLFLVIVFGKDIYLKNLHVSDSILAEAEAFLKYEKYLVAIAPITYLLLQLLYTDVLINSIANAVMSVSGIGLSVLFTKQYGTMGASLGMSIGTAFAVLILSTHFLGKKNIFSFRWHFSWKDVMEMFRLSLVDSSKYLDSGLLMGFINSYILKNYPEKTIIAASVVLAVFDLTIIFDSVGAALMPVAEIYLGEGNNQDEKNVARYSFRLSVVFGVVVATILFCTAPVFPGIFGVSDPSSATDAIKGVRWLSFSMPLFSISFVIISQYVAIRRIWLAVAFEWGKAFVLPVLLIALCGRRFGFYGIWASFIPAEIISVFGFLIGIRLFAGKEKSIWLIDNNKYPTFSRSYLLTDKTAIEARDDIETFLRKNDVSNNSIVKIMITVEEMAEIVREINKKKTVIMQFTVVVQEDCICVYERDNGSVYDLTDCDITMKNFRSYIYDCMIETCDNRQYILTIDYNRNVFRFKADSAANDTFGNQKETKNDRL